MMGVLLSCSKESIKQTADQPGVSVDTSGPAGDSDFSSVGENSGTSEDTGSGGETPGGSSSGSGGGSQIAPPVSPRTYEYPSNVDEHGNRTDAGAYSLDPCQQDPPGPGCDPSYKNE